jgi:hypothetical protein
MSYVKMPRGSILQIQAKDLLASPAGTSLVWNKVTEHNRSEFSVQINRIEKQVRTANGSMRKFFIADKKSFSVGWTMLPSYRSLTVDGGWGAEDLRTFYNSAGGQGEFLIRVNLAKDGTNQESSGYEEYNVIFSQCNFSVLKRGIQPHWSVNITLDEV